MSRRAAALVLAILLPALLAPAASATGERERLSRGANWQPIPELIQPAADPDPVPNNTIGVRSSIAYVGGGEIAIIGEVMSRITSRREFVQVRGTLYNASQQVLGTVQEAIWIERLAWGSTSPFVLFRSAPAGTALYSVAVVDNGTAISGAPVGVLKLTSNPVVINAPNQTRTYSGTIKNPGNFTVNSYVYVTTFDADGDVLDAGLQLIDLCPNCTADYSIPIFYDPMLPVARAFVQADGRRQGVPSNYLTSLDNYFSDLGTTSFKGDILWLYDSGIAAGCAPARFCPTQNVLRDQMASFLSRALELTGTPPDAFSDDNGNLHELQINRIAAEGIASGCATGLYCPSDPVRRDAMASFLARALELTGTPPDAFTDDNGNIHELNINRVAAAGVATGCGGGKFCPASLVTREQMAAFLRRAFD
jgi:hypothetical protein